MKFIAKYGIGIYLIISLLFKLHFIIPVTLVNALYQILMVLGILLFILYSKQLFKKKNIAAFRVLYFILIFNLVYLIVFNFNTESVLYILAKFSTTNLIAFGLITNYNFYKQFFIRYFKYIIAIMLFLGYFFVGIGGTTGGGQRLAIGFNPNDVGLFGAFGVLSIMLFTPNWFKSKKELFLLLSFMLLTLLSGSKAALLNVLLGSLFIYRLSFKIVAIGIVVFLTFLVTPKLGFTTSIDRLMSSEKTFETRNEVFEIGILTIKDAFFQGHGIDKYGWTNPKYWPKPEDALGPHSTYLSIGIMYGIIFGSLFLLILLSILMKAIKSYFKFKDVFVKFCVLIIVLTFINGFFESLIIAVNEFITILFWFAVGVLGYYKLNYKKC